MHSKKSGRRGLAASASVAAIAAALWASDAASETITISTAQTTPVFAVSDPTGIVNVTATGSVTTQFGGNHAIQPFMTPGLGAWTVNVDGSVKVLDVDNEVYGVWLRAGGTVNVGSTGKVEGSRKGVVIENGVANVQNDGLITGSRIAAHVLSGGAVENRGTMEGGVVFATSATPGMFVNEGSVSSNGGGFGVIMNAGGSIDNSGDVHFTNIGQGLWSRGAFSFSNSGTYIADGNGSYVGSIYAVLMQDGDVVADNTGLIEGRDVGMFVFQGTADVTNSGTIRASNLHAVALQTAGAASFTQTAGLLEGGRHGLSVVTSGDTDISVTGGTITGGLADPTGAGVRFGGGGATTMTVENATVTGAAAAILGGSGTFDLALLNGSNINGDIKLGSGDSALEIETGAVINGDIDGEAGSNTLRLSGIGSGTFAGDFSSFSSAEINANGGTWTLGGNGSFAGGMAVASGTLRVNGTIGGDVTTAAGTVLGGSGTINGAVVVADGGTVAPGSSPGTLTVGSLVLNSGSALDYELGAVSGVNDLIEVTGDLTLDGVLNITDIGGFGPGIYRLINYGGDLTDRGLEFGTLPGGVTAADLTVQASVAKQINLISTAGAVLQFWDGDAAGNGDNGTVDGGNGTWTATGWTWTIADGSVNGAMKPKPGFAIFQGSAGTVIADAGAGALAVTGMHFATNGYRIEGDAITLAGAGGESIVRVGDGTATGAGHTATIVSELTGTSSLVKTDLGTLVLTGDNRYSGGTRIEDGTLSVSRDANLGDAAGGLSFDGGTLQNTASFSTARTITLAPGGGSFDTDADLTVAGPISGAGGLTKTGAATLTLTGANSYAGNTLVEAGTLVGNAASIRGDIGNAGTVVFEQGTNATFGGAVAGLGGTNGTMIKRGAGALTLAGTSTLDWTVEAGGLVAAAGRFSGDVAIAATGAFTFDQGSDAAYAGVLSGGGSFVKDGAGLLTLSADSSGFTGHTQVAAGTLIVGAGASLGGTIDVRGRLGGSGTVGTTIVRTGGTIAPGNSIGTLTITGDYTQQAGSTYQAEIDATGRSDLIDVAGTATIEGGTAFALKASGGYGTGRYTLLTADGGVSGSYDALDQNAPFVDLALAYDAKAIHLEITRNEASFCDVAVSRNQCAVGNGAESLGAGNPVYDAIVGLPDEETARNAFDQLSGEIHASLKAGLIEDSHFVRDAVNDRIRAAFGAAGSLPVMAYGPDGAHVAAADTDSFAIWSRAYGAWGSFDGDDNAAKLETSTGGLFIGADAPAGESWRLGLLAGYGHSSFTADGRASSADIDNYVIAAYAGTELGRLGMGDIGLRFGAAHSRHDIGSGRSISFPGFADQAEASYEARTTQIFGEAGYTVDAGRASFEPFANLAYVNLSTDGYDEGGAAGLHGSGEDSDVTYTTLGLRAATAIDIAGMTGSLYGTLGWRHAFGDITPLTTHAFAGGVAFTIAGVPIAKDAATLEAGFDVHLNAGATLGIAYQGQFGSGARQNGFNAKLAVSF